MLDRTDLFLHTCILLPYSFALSLARSLFPSRLLTHSFFPSLSLSLSFFLSLFLYLSQLVHFGAHHQAGSDVHW